MSQQGPLELRESFLGCLLGCAVGDALGAPFEGLWSRDIPEVNELLAGFSLFEGYALGQFTDDTQLSLATVKSIIRAKDVVPPDIARSIASLFRRSSVIGPGGACMQAAHAFLESGDWTTCGAPIGQAGNGTAMRTAVLGLFFLNDAKRLLETVADVSRITHRDPRSVAGGIAIAKAALILASDEPALPKAFCSQIADATMPFESQFAGMIRELPDLLYVEPDAAIRQIAWSGMETPEFETPIITPFVVPTVLAALWCVLRNPNSWPNAVAAAIRMGGDVDTLGAIVGALMGAKLGQRAIPEHLRESVVDSEGIQVLASRYHALICGSLEQRKP